MVRLFLEGRSLQEAIEINKIYIVNYKDVLDICCADNRKVIVTIIKIKNLFHAAMRDSFFQEPDALVSSIGTKK
jgi:hypothetical protein